MTRAIAALAFLLCLSLPHAHAQGLTEALVVERVSAGKFEELRALEKLSAAKVPFAMYWWGFLQGECVYESCEAEASRALIVQAARAGYARARVTAIESAPNPAAMTETLKDLGPLKTVDERVAYVAWVMRVTPPAPFENPAVLARELAATDPELRVLALQSAFESPVKFQEVARAMVLAGFAPIAETYVRGEILQRRRDPEIMEAYKAGDRVAGLALCATALVRRGLEVLPADLLPICQREAAAGQVGMLPVLLRHAYASGDMERAAFYATLCERHYSLRCASELSEYHRKRDPAGEAWKVWDYVAARLAPTSFLGSQVIEASEARPREFLAIYTRYRRAEEACHSRRYDAGTKAFAPSPACSWGKPIDIPRKFILQPAKD